jgi:hypothetical protein
MHRNTLLAEVMEQLRLLPPDRLRRISANASLRPQVKVRAQELSRPKGLRIRR